MRISVFSAAAKATLARWAGHMARHPTRSAVGLLGVLFGAYLYTNSYDTLYYDAGGYWSLANQFWGLGHFEFLAFDSILRGYLFPLLISPLTLLTAYLGWAPIDLTRAVGVVTAAILFGGVGPGLWRALRGPGAPAVPLGRRLVFGLLGLALWRGYFNFSLTDFPALLALLAGLWALLRGRSVGSGLMAGLALAAAANFRPVYAAALPLAACLCLWPRPAMGPLARSRATEWGRRLAFVVGIGLVLYPQLVLNQEHYGVSSPLVLTAKPEERNLYLGQLRGGFISQKYETNVGSDYPQPQMFFTDKVGEELLGQPEFREFDSVGSYLAGVAAHPVEVLALLGRHLFNGLDLQYPTPYPQEIFVSTWPLAWLNYTALLIGAGLLVWLGWRRPTAAYVRVLIVLATLLGPCAVSLPVVMECRFLMPLHLVLCATAAFAFHPRRLWRAASPTARALSLSLYALLVVGCFALSMDHQLQLSVQPRRLFEWQAPAARPW